MRILMCSAAVAGFLTLASGQAFAEWDEQTGWYGRIGVGTNFSREADIDVNDPQNLGSAEKKGEVAAEIAFGYDFEGPLRGEIVLHRENEGMEGGQTGPDPANDVYYDHVKVGTENSVGVNGYIDFRRDRRLQPYVGLGIGMANRDETRNWDDQSTTAVDISTSRQTATKLYAQAEAGLGFRMTPRWTAEADLAYRYTSAGEFVDNTTQLSGNLGLRRKFGAIDHYTRPVPPKPPAPTVPVARPLPDPEPVIPVAPTADTFVPEPSCTPIDHQVYFDHNKAHVSKDEQTRLDTLAANPNTCLPGHLRVVGHTDSSGNADYNRKLAQKRAMAVKEQLMIRGVEDSQITLYSAGERELAVQTGDGVRNRQNRRVTIEELTLN